jgi:SAM-dependent methyltransferase
VLDIGCGSGQPIAAYLAGRGHRVAGIDGSPEMIALFRANLPCCGVPQTLVVTADAHHRGGRKAGASDHQIASAHEGSNVTTIHRWRFPATIGGWLG